MYKKPLIVGIAMLAIAGLCAPNSYGATPNDKGNSGSTSDATPNLVAVQEVPMTIVGFDTAAARRAGNRVTAEGGDRVLRDAAGVEIARIPRKGSGSDLSALNQVIGNCGTSYFYLYDATGASFYIRTGFNVTSNAFDFVWNVNVRGENSSQVDNWDWSDTGPMWPATSWTSGNIYSTQDTAAGTYYYGRVTYGAAYLTNGVICFSGYPNDGKWLYK